LEDFRRVAGMAGVSLAPDAIAIDRRPAPHVPPKPHFVLMDYNTPGKDGITLASELRALDAEMGIAVISANQ
jgi:Response regulator containing CheY-like receiver domain and AraC-type DNA-binding domain